MLLGHLGEGLDLVELDAGRVLGLEVDAQPAVVQLLLEGVGERADLVGAGRVAHVEAELLVAHPVVAEGAAEVDRALTTVGVEELRREDAVLHAVHAEVGGDHVADLRSGRRWCWAPSTRKSMKPGDTTLPVASMVLAPWSGWVLTAVMVQLTVDADVGHTVEAGRRVDPRGHR